ISVCCSSSWGSVQPISRFSIFHWTATVMLCCHYWRQGVIYFMWIIISLAKSPHLKISQHILILARTPAHRSLLIVCLVGNTGLGQLSEPLVTTCTLLPARQQNHSLWMILLLPN